MLRLAFTLLLVLGAPWALAAESAVLLKDDVLRSKPFLDGKVQATLKRGNSVQIVRRQGAWTQVQQQKLSGWVRSLSLRSGALRSAPTLASGNTGRLGTGRIVSTTGIRGLEAGDEQQLAKARFDGAALEAARAQAVDADAARRFAREGKLASRSVQWLKEPRP